MIERMSVTIHSPAPFLSILTRACRRPKMLAVNRASIAASTDRSYEQVILTDNKGRGMEWANNQFFRCRNYGGGEYVLLLDDDDCLAGPAVVSDLRRIIENYREAEEQLGPPPDVIAFRVDHGRLGILPNDGDFGERPKRDCIGGSSVVVRRELWIDTIHEFKGKRRADYRWLSHLWDQNPIVHWLDKVLIRCQRISGGAPE